MTGVTVLPAMPFLRWAGLLWSSIEFWVVFVYLLLMPGLAVNNGLSLDRLWTGLDLESQVLALLFIYVGLNVVLERWPILQCSVAQMLSNNPLIKEQISETIFKTMFWLALRSAMASTMAPTVQLCDHLFAISKRSNEQMDGTDETLGKRWAGDGLAVDSRWPHIHWVAMDSVVY